MESRPGVLFVCLGNICRSPAAEGVFLSLLEEQGLEAEVLVDSAGILDEHEGEPADRRMRSAAERRGIELSSRSRQVRSSDFETFQLIIAMDRDNFQDLEALSRERAREKEGTSTEARIVLMGSFLDGDHPPDVPDPYYGGPQGFEQVLDMLQEACPNLLSEVVTSARV